MKKRFMLNYWSVFVVLIISLWSTTGFAKKSDRNLEGWWKFDDFADLTVDSSGHNRNPAKLIGDINYIADGLHNGALEFQPSGMLEIPHFSGLTPEIGTIQLWIQLPELQDSYLFLKTTNRLLRKWPDIPVSIGVYGMRIKKDGSIVSFIANDDPVEGIWRVLTTKTNVLSAKTWHMLTMRWDGKHFAIFCDGKLHAKTRYNPIPGVGLSFSGTSPLHFAKENYSPFVGYFNGYIDEIKIYSRALKKREIRSEYKKMVHKHTKPKGHKTVH